MNILQSELQNRGFNEFYNDNQLTFYEDEHVFIKKILNYDKDVEEIVNLKFFFNIKLDNPEHDKKFKRQWMNKFLNYRPSFQTMEIFASEVVYVFMNNIDFLNEYYENITDYVRGKQDNKNVGNENRITDNRYAQATLPQDEVNLNVDDTILNYADENQITRNKETLERENKDDNFNYDLETLNNSRVLLKQVFEEFEKHCFLKTW